MPIRISLAAAAAAASLLAACAGEPGTMKRYDQSSLPGPVQVPVGHRVAMEAVGTGEITYECRPKPGSTTEFDWFVVKSTATMMQRGGRQLGRFSAPPATWESTDGSRLTTAQVAVAPALAGNLPYELVRATAAAGDGVMDGVTYIQRVATRGGVASAACGGATMGDRQAVPYQADYIFYRGYSRG